MRNNMNDFIYEQYDRHTPVLKTVEDCEREIRRARSEYELFCKKYWSPKLNRWVYNIPQGLSYINFLIRRIENCHIKINQLKNKKSIRDSTKEDII